jgi:DNA-binding CsgD family transcriptional regulator
MNATELVESLAAIGALQSELNYPGPERRGGVGAGLVRLLSCVLEEIDYGLILIGADGYVIHANHGATSELSAEMSGLEISAKRLKCRNPADQAKLNGAFDAAQRLGRRSMLQLGLAGPTALSIVPLPVALSCNDHGHAVLVTMQRNRIVETLSVGAYSRAHGLSQREEQVLALLCDGMRAADIAAQLKISQATVRSHVYNLKAKTGCNSMLELVKQVAVLPPMVEALNRPQAVTQA